MRSLQVGDIVPREDGPYRVLSISEDQGFCQLVKHEGPEPNSVVWWVAVLENDTSIGSADVDSIERVHERGVIKMLVVHVEGREQPIRVSCDPTVGQRMHLFTRRAVRNAGTPAAHQVNMPVIELKTSYGFVRTYIHPEHGVFVSSLDLNL